MCYLLKVILNVYTDLIISTIVDANVVKYVSKRLYGLDNFYYRRYNTEGKGDIHVYTDLIISTIVDT